MYPGALLPFPPTIGPGSPKADHHTQKSGIEYHLGLDGFEPKLSDTVLDPPNRNTEADKPRALLPAGRYFKKKIDCKINIKNLLPYTKLQ